ncbi:MAG: hypothetical protein NVS2B8_13330 [Vulcanimicrobiaceae bacterium]
MPRHRLDVGGTFAGTSFLPTGVFITPTAAQNSQFMPLATGLRPDGNADATDASATALSPDGKQLLVLTSGYNTNFNDQSNHPLTYAIPDPLTGVPTSVSTKNSEWVFVYDVTTGTPTKLQQLSIPNTYSGIAWAPDGSGFYVSGGIDDRILAFAKTAATAGAYAIKAPALVLGHNGNDDQPIPAYDGGILKGTPAGAKFGTGAVAAQLATSRDGKTLAVANMENDSVSIVQTKKPYGVVDVAFTKPGSNVARGEFPFGVAVTSDSANAAQTIYVSSLRDSQVVAVDAKTRAIRRTITVGSGPNALLLSHDESRLYVADGNSDDIAVIDTQRDVLLGRIALGGPFKGMNPNSLALSPDGATLYVTLGGATPIIPITRTPFASNAPQASIGKIDLAQNSDPYFRGYDNAAPDIFRYEEWAREFDNYVANDNLPNLELVRIMHDHFGKFKQAVGGLNTPALQMADNDYALGKIVEKVSHSPYWKHTAIFVVEDDPQDGPDHVDMHRSIALVASPHVRREAVIHDDFTTVNVIRTIEDLLGMQPLGYYDANATSMASIFGDGASAEPFDAIVPGSLCAAPVSPDLVGEDCSNRSTDARRRSIKSGRPGAPAPRTRVIRRIGAASVDLHDGAWWSAMTEGMNFDQADKVDPTKFNAILWYGMTGTLAPQTAKL